MLASSLTEDQKTKHPEPGLHFLAFLPHEQRAVTWYHRQEKEQTELPPQGTPMAKHSCVYCCVNTTPHFLLRVGDTFQRKYNVHCCHHRERK